MWCRSFSCLSALVVVALAPRVFAQANFDPPNPPAACIAYPSPCGAGVAPEFVSWNGAPTGFAGPAVAGCPGFPTSGPRFAFLNAAGPAPVTPPVGGPVARPAGPGVTDMCIPIPPGATYVRFSWDFYCAEAFGSGFNDGMSIDVVTPGGALLIPLVYADASTLRVPGSFGGSCALGGGAEIAPPGPQYFAQHFNAPLPLGAYLSVLCWNGGDNIAASAAAIDDVWFGTTPSSVTFDQLPGCGSGFPAPIGAFGDPEGVSGNGAGFAAKGIGNGCGWPIGGSPGYLRMKTNGPGPAIPAGGPFPRPAAPPVNEIAVPLPIGTADISFCWEFFTAKASSGGFNDGMSIDIVAPGGALILPLAYADTFTPAGPCLDNDECGVVGFGTLERAPAGPQYVRRCIFPTPPGAYLSIIAWNMGDNTVDGIAAVDNIRMGGPGLDYVSPGGPGSGTLTLQNLGFQPGATYYTFVTLNGAGFPNAWFFGINMNIFDVLSQAASPAPFSGALNACGASSFTIGGLPAGITAYLVTLETIGGSFIEASAPFSFTSL